MTDKIKNNELSDKQYGWELLRKKLDERDGVDTSCINFDAIDYDLEKLENLTATDWSERLGNNPSAAIIEENIKTLEAPGVLKDGYEFDRATNIIVYKGKGKTGILLSFSGLLLLVAFGLLTAWPTALKFTKLDLQLPAFANSETKTEQLLEAQEDKVEDYFLAPMVQMQKIMFPVMSLPIYQPQAVSVVAEPVKAIESVKPIAPISQIKTNTISLAAAQDNKATSSAQPTTSRVGLMDKLSLEAGAQVFTSINRANHELAIGGHLNLSLELGKKFDLNLTGEFSTVTHSQNDKGQVLGASEILLADQANTTRQYRGTVLLGLDYNINRSFALSAGAGYSITTTGEQAAILSVGSKFRVNRRLSIAPELRFDSNKNMSVGVKAAWKF